VQQEQRWQLEEEKDEGRKKVHVFVNQRLSWLFVFFFFLAGSNQGESRQR
jgi:hypothetical protein